MIGLSRSYIRRKRAEGALLFAGAMELLGKGKGKDGGQASVAQLQALGIEVVGG